MIVIVERSQNAHRGHTKDFTIYILGIPGIPGILIDTSISEDVF